MAANLSDRYAALPRLEARRLSAGERDSAMAYLAADSRNNLQLRDLAWSIGLPTSSGEVAPDVMGVWRGSTLVGVASRRPSMILSAAMDPEVLDAFAPHLASVPAGLLKSARELVDSLWTGMRRRGRRALLDRVETAHFVDAASFEAVAGVAGASYRRARDADLEDLVFAARASLREEGRPDPFLDDPDSFRRWVRGRVPRARVLEVEGRLAFVAYADVQRGDGWLVQGVYTWPELRRRGFASLGMSALVREALDAGTEHVQLAVVEGNAPATRLYQRLGFRSGGELRTILFV